jgi:hypothetical protein
MPVDNGEAADCNEELNTTTSPVSNKRPLPAPGAGMIVFSAPLAKRLSGERLPPAYVGVRRVRPSSRLVARVAGKMHAEEAASSEGIVYKVVDDDGQERRMTSREKKQAKWQHKLEAKTLKLQAPSSLTEAASEMPQPLLAAGDRYVHLEVDPTSLERELADLRGNREGVPPVMLPPPLCQLAMQNNIVCVENFRPLVTVTADDKLAEEWAVHLKESMNAAELVRQGEDLRPMPYHLVPEVWSRMRPPETISAAAVANEASDGLQDTSSLATETTVKPAGGEDSRNAWAFCQIRPSSSEYDSDVAAVIQLLHCRTKLHISCGAKFGCDYLLYDGPRHERHAFAGLRILQSTNKGTMPFPCPTSYDLAGYVRCLNTAGKLALLATVVREENGRRRVLIVDLALEKIAATTSQRPRKTMEQRVKHLAKT